MSGVVAVIPARSGSKGVVDKNIKFLDGKPLMAYSIAAAQCVHNIERIIVSTDSKEYAHIAREYGAEVPFLRPQEFSKDGSTDYEVMRHLLDWMQENEQGLPSYLVHLRPTSPLRDALCIEKAIEVAQQSESMTALRSVHEMSESAYKTFEIEEHFLKSVGSGTFSLDAANDARQKFEKTYQANGYVDVIITSYVMEHQKLHGDRVLGYVTPHITEVDTQDDFDYLEYQVKQNPECVRKIFL